MNRISLYLLIVATVVSWTQSVALSGDLGDAGGYNDNPHNLSVNATHGGIQALTEDEICIFCHTPHGGTPETPLWNRRDPLGMGSFPLFNNAASVQDTSGLFGIDDPAIVATTQYGSDYPNGSSKLCLSCHDGVSAIGAVIAGNQGVDIDMNGGVTMDDFAGSKHFNTGTDGTLDLAASHPVSFVYNEAVKNYVNSLGKTDVLKYPLTLGLAKLDGLERVQCTTCHQPHKDTREGTYNLPFWRVTQSNYTDDTQDYIDTCNECHTSAYAIGDFDDHNYP